MSAFEDQTRRLRDAGNLFSPDRPIFIGRAPGRLDLMGGNDDYTGGLVFEATIREATWAAVQLREDERIVFLNPQMAEKGWQERAEFALAALADEAGVRAFSYEPGLRWTAYTLGVFHYLKTRQPDLLTRGASVFLFSEVPFNKGVSSSASVEVALMKTAAYAYGAPMQGERLAEACQWVENVIAGSACGIMDQVAVTLGEEGCVLPMLCQPALVEPLVHLPETLATWAVDSGVSHEVSGLEYEAARAAAFMGYKLICDQMNIPVTLDEHAAIPHWTDPVLNGYLANLPPALFRSKYEARLPEILTGAEFLRLAGTHVDPFTAIVPEHPYRVRANTRYAVEENHRVHLFSELARGATGDSHRAFRLMGELMCQSHEAYTECGLGSVATDLLVSLVREEGASDTPSRFGRGLGVGGLFGAKVTGGGAGGTVAILGLKTATDAFRRVVDRFGAIRGFMPYVFEGSSMGADRFGVKTLTP